MTRDGNIKSNLKFLDKILEYLVNETSDYTTSFDNLYKYKFDRELQEDNKMNALGYLTKISKKKVESFEDLFAGSISDNTKAQGEKLVEALYYLNSKGFIRLDVNYNARITFEGIIQYSKTFLGEHKKQLKIDFINQYNIHITILIGIAGIIVGAVFNAC